jgi:hypothetical protein
VYVFPSPQKVTVEPNNKTANHPATPEVRRHQPRAIVIRARSLLDDVRLAFVIANADRTKRTLVQTIDVTPLVLE